MRKNKPLTLVEIQSYRMRDQWRERILKLAAAVKDNKVGVEALWAIDETRSLYEQALQWHAYNRAATDCVKNHRAVPSDQ